MQHSLSLHRKPNMLHTDLFLCTFLAVRLVCLLKALQKSTDFVNILQVIDKKPQNDALEGKDTRKLCDTVITTLRKHWENRKMRFTSELYSF